MAIRLNLPTALVLCLLWLLLLLVAAVCTRSFALWLLLPHLLLCVCQCRRLAFMLVVHTAVLTRTYGFPCTSNVRRRVKNEGGDMKRHGLWPQRSEHSGIVRCESTALVHACSRGCVIVSGRAKASAKGRRDGPTA